MLHDGKPPDLNDILTQQGSVAARAWLEDKREFESYGRTDDGQHQQRDWVHAEDAEEGPGPETGAAADAAMFEPEDLADLLEGDIPPRQWLLGTSICLNYVTVVAAAGGAGKTTLALAWALSLAIGRALVGDYVHRCSRVLVLTFEDDRDEYRRRLKALCIHHGITDVKHGWLLVKSLNGLGVKFATQSKSGVMVETGAPTRIMEVIKRYSIDVVILDPFIKLSGAPENDNTATDAVACILTRIAEQRSVALLVLHHFRKGAAIAGDMDAARGAKALIDASRISYTLLPMSNEDATAMGVSEEERRRIVRLDDGKINTVLADPNARWYRLASVNIGNGTAEYPNGDNVQAIEHWNPPKTWGEMSCDLLNRILDEIEKGMSDGERYSAAPSAKKRAAWSIVQMHAPNKTEPQCREIIKTWLKTGVLLKEDYDSPKEHKKFEGLQVDASKRPSRGPQ